MTWFLNDSEQHQADQVYLSSNAKLNRQGSLKWDSLIVTLCDSMCSHRVKWLCQHKSWSAIMTVSAILLHKKKKKDWASDICILPKRATIQLSSTEACVTFLLPLSPAGRLEQILCNSSSSALHSQTTNEALETEGQDTRWRRRCVNQLQDKQKKQRRIGRPASLCSHITSLCTKCSANAREHDKLTDNK